MLQTTMTISITQSMLSVEIKKNSQSKSNNEPTCSTKKKKPARHNSYVYQKKITSQNKIEETAFFCIVIDPLRGCHLVAILEVN